MPVQKVKSKKLKAISKNDFETSSFSLITSNFKVKLGFTLIELLVVISIIAILITVIAATFGTTQQKARDSRRKTDLDALKKSLELVKSDSKGSSWYPNCDTTDPLINGCRVNADRAIFAADLDVVYMKEVPDDPSSPIGYAYIPAGCTGPNSPEGRSTCDSYTIIACLENKNDADKDTPKFAQCTVASYRITNP